MHAGIAGAGLLGRLLALELHHAGWQVTVFDSETAVATTSAGHTAAGMLSPYAELESGDDQIFELGHRSLILWPQMLAKLAQPVYFRQAGSLLTAHRQDAPAARRLINLINRKLAGRESFAPLSAEQANALEPSLTLPGESYFFPAEGQVDSQHFMNGVYQTLATAVTWQWEQAVTAVASHTLTLADGTQHRFDWVFDCRGLGAKVQHEQLRGVRGELIWLQTSEITVQRPVRLMHPRYRLYLVPRPNHIFIIGASEIESEDDSPISVRSTLELLSAVYSLHPAFGEARILKTDTNCRPALPNNLPILETKPGMTMINGLFRHGYLLAPALAEKALNEIGV